MSSKDDTCLDELVLTINYYPSCRPNLSLLRTRSVKMYSASRKIQKDKGAEPSEFEETVAQVFYVAIFITYLIFLIIHLQEF